MGQKVNPNGLRLGINRDWSSHWCADKKTFPKYLHEDILIRNYLEPLLDGINVSRTASRFPSSLPSRLLLSAPILLRSMLLRRTLSRSLRRIRRTSKSALLKSRILT